MAPLREAQVAGLVIVLELGLGILELLQELVLLRRAGDDVGARDREEEREDQEPSRALSHLCRPRPMHPGRP